MSDILDAAFDAMRAVDRRLAAHLTPDAAAEYLDLTERAIADAVAVGQDAMTPGVARVRAAERAARKRALVRDHWLDDDRTAERADEARRAFLLHEMCGPDERSL